MKGRKNERKMKGKRKKWKEGGYGECEMTGMAE